MNVNCFLVMLLILSTKDYEEEPRDKHYILFVKGQMTQCILRKMT